MKRASVAPVRLPETRGSLAQCGRPVRSRERTVDPDGALISLLWLGVRDLTAGGDDVTVTDAAMKEAMRHIASVFSELEKTGL
jgi:hypothetical protein